jgi:hypothetical protein
MVPIFQRLGGDMFDTATLSAIEENETYRRIGGRWVIQTETLRRQRIDVS